MGYDLQLSLRDSTVALWRVTFTPDSTCGSLSRIWNIPCVGFWDIN
jgi:hypothetical protein